MRINDSPDSNYDVPSKCVTNNQAQVHPIMQTHIPDYVPIFRNDIVLIHTATVSQEQSFLLHQLLRRNIFEPLHKLLSRYSLHLFRPPKKQ